MGRAPCCDKANVKKGPWSPEEDAKLKEYIDKYGIGGNWIALPQKVGLKRCGKSCRLRWLNYLRPNIKHGEFSDEEDRIICTLFSNIGSRWSIIAAQLPGRTDNDIKNYWNTKLKKKLMSFVHNSNIITSYPNNTMHQRNKFLFSNNIPPLVQTSSDHHYDQTVFQSSTLSALSTTFSPTYTMMHSDPRTSSGLYSNLINFQANNNNGLSDHWGQSSGNPNSVMFGSSSTTNEGSHCSTSSDGSCNFQIKQEEIHGFLQHRQAPQTSFVGLLSNGNNYGGGYNGNSVAGDDSSKVNLMWGQKSTGGCFGLDDGHDYQYYYPSSSSPASTCVSEDQVNKQVNNNYFVSLFNVGENKTQENYNKVMYF